MNSKCSKKLRNIFENEKNRLFGEQKIFEVYKYDNGDEFEEAFDVFPIVDYLSKIDELLNEYSYSINAINDYRDNYFAHRSPIWRKGSSESKSRTADTRKPRLLHLWRYLENTCPKTICRNVPYSKHSWIRLLSTKMER